jgi:c-di-GMP-binding flagellar brake protein YcgR
MFSALQYFIVSSPSRHPGTEPDVSGRAPERRIHHRVLVGASAWLVTDDERHSAECVNVSMGGAAVTTSARIPTGNVIRFELSLGLDHRSVAIQCEVVRSSQTELGLRFLALDRASLEAVLSLL